jgi:hypothetical protein
MGRHPVSGFHSLLIASGQVLNHFGGVAIWPGIDRQIASVPGENQSLSRRKSRLKGGCSQDWLPHKACETIGPQNG